jgi:uncharacterized protein (DUF302 family)
MSYYFSKKISGDFDDVLQRTIQALREEGFGILTDIDVRKTLKKKLERDFRKYRILGACNPPFAYQALQEEEKIGLLLPCNVIIQEAGEREVDVAVIDPVNAMAGVQNSKLATIAEEVSRKLRSVIDRIPDKIDS